MEAGFRITKDIIFERVKAYNAVEVFKLLSQKMNNYYVTKLLNIANNRGEHFTSKHFQLRQFNMEGYCLSPIRDGSGNLVPLVYTVNSNQNSGYLYVVDLEIGTCSGCLISRGTCPHLAFAARETGHAGQVMAPTFDPVARHQYAVIALGNQAPPLEHFADLHQKKHEHFRKNLAMPDMQPNQTSQHNFVIPTVGETTFEGTQMDQIADADAFEDTEMESAADSDMDSEPIEENAEEVGNNVLLAENLSYVELMQDALRSQSNNLRLLKAAAKLLRKAANAMKDGNITALTDMATNTGRRHAPGSRSGIRIPVQVTATARRSRTNSRGRRTQIAGRPSTRSTQNAATSVAGLSSQVIPARKKKTRARRAHNLSQAVDRNQANGGQ